MAVGSPHRSALETQVARILLRHSTADLSADAVAPQTPLIDSGFNLSSVDLLEALVEIEQALHIRLTDEALTIEGLSSFGLFMDHVCRLMPTSG